LVEEELEELEVLVKLIVELRIGEQTVERPDELPTLQDY
jgi:hypothetical protein